mmetsp:Transcript_45168/g.84289  ORF Transcript_45168/g.84289 Transcript_45168/m.84289 type:complete len:136 (+) Transcript_45168:91-498(+)
MHGRGYGIDSSTLLICARVKVFSATVEDGVQEADKHWRYLDRGVTYTMVTGAAHGNLQTGMGQDTNSEDRPVPPPEPTIQIKSGRQIVDPQQENLASVCMKETMHKTTNDWNQIHGVRSTPRLKGITTQTGWPRL